MAADTKAQAGKEKKRSYAEVLARSAPLLEEPFGVVSEPVAKVPRWVKELSEGRHCEGMPTSNSGQVSVLGKRRFIAPAASSAQVYLPAKLPSSNGAGQVAEKGYGASDMTCLLGDRIDFLSLRDSLLQLKVDIGACLERVDGLLGSRENLAELSLKSCPTCMMDNDLGSQLIYFPPLIDNFETDIWASSNIYIYIYDNTKTFTNSFNKIGQYL